MKISRENWFIFYDEQTLVPRIQNPAVLEDSIEFFHGRLQDDLPREPLELPAPAWPP